MSSIIQVLPDHVANQIAAGEVVQRPASVVKELMENSVDAESTSIIVNIVDAGRTLIQVIDDGKGMSETDARLSFERHATSKIRSVNDLFALHSMGFRGEALASIAAISEVELRSRRENDEIGSRVVINGSSFVCQEPDSCAKGSNISVKNLFFNVPARRKFLKVNATELKHIITEFQRVALAFPNIEMILQHNNTEIYNLARGSFKQRIVNIIGKNANQYLVPIQSSTSIVKITGFVGKPEYARKTSGEQFFFVNNRYMRHGYFHRAATAAYDKLISSDSMPCYFICFESDPASIDVNIHPTKTEIKFTDEQSIWQILNACVKESLGKANFMPSIDFDTQYRIDIPTITKNSSIHSPGVPVNTAFNPFNERSSYPGGNIRGGITPHREDISNWQDIFDVLKGSDKEDLPEIKANENIASAMNEERAPSHLIQLKNRYILSPVRSGLMIIDQQRAHERILFERYMQILDKNIGIIQQNLFPQTVELNPADYALVLELTQELVKLGFDVSDFGNNCIVVNGMPADSRNADPRNMLEQVLEDYKETARDSKIEKTIRVARSMAMAGAVKQGTLLKQEEMREIIDQLFACLEPGFSPSGNPVLHILSMEDIMKMF